jgi:hypothetical protein
MDQAWYARFARARPNVSQILYDLKKKQLEGPIFLCLHCTKQTHSQYAMAAHCRQHVRAGMGKGTVKHIKYYPDHTFILLGKNSQPSPPQPPGSTAQQVMAEASKPMNQVPTRRYNWILPYTGCLTLSDLAKSPWLQLNGSHKNSIIHTSNLHATHATLQPSRYNPIGGLSSVFPNGGLLTPNANGVGTSITTPASASPEIDLTLRLGPPTPRPTAEVSALGTSYPFRIVHYF